MDIQVGKKTMEINLLSKEGNAVKIDIDGTEYNVDIAMLLNGTYSILKDGISYNAEGTPGEWKALQGECELLHLQHRHAGLTGQIYEIEETQLSRS